MGRRLEGLFNFVERMKWLAGTWSSEGWATWAKESPWDFPYDQEGYADALGQTWGAVAGAGLAWPMAYRRKGIFWTAYLPFGMQQWGPVGAQANRSALVLAAAAAIPGRFAKVDVCVHKPTDWQTQSPVWRMKGFRLERWTEKPNYVLDISGSYEQIHGRFNKQLLRNLKEAKRHAMTLFEHDTPETLYQAFERYQGERYAVPTGFGPAIRQAMYHLLHQGKGAVWSVYGEGNRFLAGAFFAFSGNRVVLLFSAISDEGRETQAMAHLLNEFLVFAAGRWTYFDFEGSEAPGLARFYAGFGAELQPYLRYQRWALL